MIKTQSYRVHETIFQVILDKYKKLWISLQNGGVLYFNKSLEAPHSLEKPIKLLDQYIINNVLVDRDKNVWISSRNDGLFFISAASFSSYENIPLQENSSYITSISANSKNIFLGYNSAMGGIYNLAGLNHLVFAKNKKLENKAIYANEKFAYFGHAKDFYEYNIFTKKISLLNSSSVIKNRQLYTLMYHCIKSFCNNII